MAEDGLNEQEVQEQVESEIHLAKEFARRISFEEVQSGEWFIKLLQQVVNSYRKNARAEYFQQKYPGLPADEIADILISVTVRYAAIAGALTGVAVSANQIALVGSAGMTAALFVGSLGAEMVYLARLQIRLVLDLSVVYDLQLDPDDPEDILMIFGYALGITPTELVGKGLQIAAGAGTKTAIKHLITKGTLKSIQEFARQLGFKILQRTIIKYAVPAVSAAVGSTFNYSTTLSVGKIAKAHFRNKDKGSEELRLLVTRQNLYELIYPAAVMYVAQVDGELKPGERDLYKSMLTRMTIEVHQQQEFQRLLKNETHLLEAIGQIKDPVAAETMLDLLCLMAIYDGELMEAEVQFLQKAATALGIELDIQILKQRANSFHIDYSNPQWRKVVDKTNASLGLARETGAQLMQSSTEKAKNAVRGLFRKKDSTFESSEADNS